MPKSPSQAIQLIPAIRQTVLDLLALIDMLMPGVKHIPVQDYRLLNEAPIQARQLLATLNAAPVCGFVQTADFAPIAEPERTVITDLIDLACRINTALDDSEEMEGSDGERIHVINSQNFDDVCEALHRLEELPDDKPEETLCPGGRAEWALRRILDLGA